MSGEGMVAVVQSLRDARLAVTLVDGSHNKFSLVPNPNTGEKVIEARKYQVVQQSSAAAEPAIVRCDTSAQATDGRYASMYQTTHGNVEPTSPPYEVTEFPPQRAELCRGRGNFEVGGLGSGETGHVPIKPQQGTYRGGMVWVDRGAVFSPRSSQQTDAFANSLRKYPATSPERSSELFERLITYSQAKSVPKYQGKGTSPTRTPQEAEVPQMYNERTRRPRCEEMRSRTNEYPTRDGRPRKEECEQRNYNRSYDATRYDRELARPKDYGRPNDLYQYNVRDLASYQRKFMSNSITNSVYTETQPIPTCSREVATAPRSSPRKKNAAVPRSASASTVGPPEGAVSDIQSSSQVENTKIISFKSVQTTSSSLELTSALKSINPRKSKSEDDLKRQHFQEGIIQLIGNMAVNSKVKENVLSENILKDMWIKLHRLLQNVEKQNSREKALIHLGKKIKKTPIYIPIRYEDCTKTRIRRWTELDVYRAALPQFQITNVEDRMKDIVKDWVGSLPFQSHNTNGIPFDKIKISDDLVRGIFKLLTAKAKINCESLKRQIVHKISQTPIEVTGKRHSLHSFADILVSQLRNIAPNIFKKRSKIKSSCSLRTHTHPTEDNIKEWISNVMEDFIEKYNLELNTKNMAEIKTELIEIVINFIYGGIFVSEKVFKEDIMSFLADYNIKEDQSKDLADAIFDQVNQRTLSQTKHNRNFIVCYNTSIKRRPMSFFNASESLNVYKNVLCEQINEWLTDLPVEVLKVSSRVREKAIKDLAEELVDRQMYLEFNSSKISEENELEYLKYQIYKWISKIVGEDNINLVEHASDLMKRIREIAVPKTNIQNFEVRNSSNIHLNNTKSRKYRPSILKPNVSKNQTEQNPSLCTQKTLPRISIQTLNDEYDEYVKNWVQKIPIPTKTPQEIELSDKLRLGLQNGIWKALTKLKFDPVTFHNTFYYQDLLDDEIESLLNSLPKSPELDSKKHAMKAQLLEYTCNTNEKLLKLAEPASFKQSLVENVENHVPRNNDDNNEAIKLHEDLQILSIVEDYILLTNYDEDNKVKANAFKKKLTKNVEAFVEKLKETHGKELKDIDISIYMSDIMEALHNVPIPSEDSLREDADEIILGIEIEHWFNDLPLVPNDDYFEQLQRRRLRDTLTKKIIDIEKGNLNTCAAESAVNNEIKNCLNGLPLKIEEVINIKFYADELSNRIKNKRREQNNGRRISRERRSVAFQRPLSFQELQSYREEPHSSNQFIVPQPKLYNSLPNPLTKYQSAQNSSNANQPQISFQDLPNTSRDKSKSFNNFPSEPVQYHPIPTSQNLNNSTLVGGGILYNPRAINNTIDENHDYHGFEGNQPLSSSMFSLPSNIYGNTQSPSRAEPSWNSGAQSQYGRSYPGVHNASEAAGSWISLEQVPIPEEIRKQLQLPKPPEAPNPGPIKSFVYSDSRSMPHSSYFENNNNSRATNKSGDTSALPQVIQDQISRINEAAIGHASNATQCSNMSQGNQVPVERSSDDLNNVNTNMDGSIPLPLQRRESVSKTRASQGIDDENSFRQQPYNQSSRKSEVYDLARSARMSQPIEQIQQNVNNRTREGSCNPRARQSQLSAQNVSNVDENASRRNMSNPVISTPQQLQIPVPNIPLINSQQMVAQENNQQQGSSYGQPQGFSTPNQQTNERSPPRIGRKRYDPLRFRSGPARRRLDLEDSDDTEEDCPCMAHLKRMPYGDSDYPCYYPFPYPYPCFF